MNLHESDRGAAALRGLIDAARQGGAYDALPSGGMRIEHWDALAPYLQPLSVRAGQMPAGLAALFSAMGVLGGWLIGVVFIGVDDGAFWSQMQASVDFRYDVWNGVIKSFVFGVAVSLIAVFEGFDSVPTAEGVSRAITRTVVTSALAILALDFILTSFMFRGTS